MWFIPNSNIPPSSKEGLIDSIAIRTPSALLRVSKALYSSEIRKPIHASECLINEKIISNAMRLDELFKTFGSDKSKNHKYHFIYGMIFANFLTSPKILEIGLGSQNPNIPSHMSSNFEPGGSLMAFQNFFPKAIVHGADIDQTISSNHFKIFHIDQTKPETFSKIDNEGEETYDLIIDDGFHSPDANLFTLEFALSKISNNGVIIIEDISIHALEIWEVVQFLIKSSAYRSAIIDGEHNGYVLLCTKKESNQLLFN